MPLNKTPSQYWFAAKRYGWGWGFPTCWQGWVVVIAYLAAVTALIALAITQESQRAYMIIGLVVLSIGYVMVCYFKGPPPRWRWGDAD